MAGRNRARRQHVVSRFYLRRFADPAGQMVRTELPGRRSHLISVANATVANDFYSVTDEAGELSDFFEKQFAQLEALAARSLEMILDQSVWPLRDDDRLAVTTWIALQYLRSESVRLMQTEMSALIIKLIVGTSGKEALRRHIELKEKAEVSQARLDAEWADLTSPAGTTLIPDVKAHIRLLYGLMSQTAAMLADRQWSLTVYDRKVLLTCDNPVSLAVRSDYPEWRGVGLATADAYLVPLSRRCSLLIGASPDLPDMRVAGTSKLAQSTNLQTIMNARRTLYWHPDDSHLLRAYPMPEPKNRLFDSSIGEHLISEEGLFARTTPEQKQASTSISQALGYGRGYGLRDLPWPIPGRKFIFEETTASSTSQHHPDA